MTGWTFRTISKFSIDTNGIFRSIDTKFELIDRLNICLVNWHLINWWLCKMNMEHVRCWLCTKATTTKKEESNDGWLIINVCRTRDCDKDLTIDIEIISAVWEEEHVLNQVDIWNMYKWIMSTYLPSSTWVSYSVKVENGIWFHLDRIDTRLNNVNR